MKPTVFQLIDLPIEQPFIPANATAPIEPDVRATSRTFDGRIYVLLLDDLHTSIATRQASSRMRSGSSRSTSARTIWPRSCTRAAGRRRGRS